MNIISFLLILTFFSRGVLGEENPRFYLEGKRLSVDWENLETKKYLDYDLYLDELKQRQENPNYDREVRDLQNFERAGLVLSCVKNCELIKGRGKNPLQYLSTIREGDEVVTKKDSYLWLFLLDGTMVRLSPETSLSFNEFNVGRDKNFIFARLNYGSLYWLSRSKNHLVQNKKRETDQLFLPLMFKKANLFSNDNFEKRFSYLNELITSNNQKVKKTTQMFLVMPNGSVMGDEVSGDFVSLFNGQTFFKVRDRSELGLKGEFKKENKVSLFLRGEQGDKSRDVITGKWFELDQLGTKLSPVSDKKLSLSEFPTRNIPTLLTARELMMKEYSLFLFSGFSKKMLGEKFGYRLWSDLEREKRISFIKSYTKRLETVQVNVLKDYWQKQKNLTPEVYGSRYYALAMKAYAAGKVETSQKKDKRVRSELKKDSGKINDKK